MEANTLGSHITVYIIVAIITAIASFLTRNLWHKLTGINMAWINTGISAITIYPILLCATLAINYFCADESTLHYESAVVERLYTKTRHHTKRISRRTMGVGEPYKVYFAEVSIQGIRNKELSFNHKQWRRLHKGDTLRLRVAKGAFGIPVVKRSGSTVEVPRSSYRY